MHHHEHHDHHHPEGCTCGCHDHHDHGHHEHDEKIQITSHDLSVAGSVKLMLDMDYGEGIKLINQILSGISRDISEQGGIVGHLKALVTDQGRTCMLSVTDEDEASITEHRITKASVECACIVMALEPHELKHIMSRHFSPYL